MLLQVNGNKLQGIFAKSHVKLRAAHSTVQKSSLVDTFDPFDQTHPVMKLYTRNLYNIFVSYCIILQQQKKAANASIQ